MVGGWSKGELFTFLSTIYIQVTLTLEGARVSEGRTTQDTPMQVHGGAGGNSLGRIQVGKQGRVK